MGRSSLDEDGVVEKWPGDNGAKPLLFVSGEVHVRLWPVNACRRFPGRNPRSFHLGIGQD